MSDAENHSTEGGAPANQLPDHAPRAPKVAIGTIVAVIILAIVGFSIALAIVGSAFQNG